MTISAHRHSGESFTIDHLSDDQLLSDVQAGDVLGIKPGTLSVWRSVGRYNLPYIKVGRLIRYRVGDIRAFIAKRTRVHTSSDEV